MINFPLIQNSFSKRSNLINLNLNYNFFNINDLHKSKLKQISSFESTININNWIIDFNNKAELDDNFLINNNYIIKTLYDFKVNIAINRNKDNINYYSYLMENKQLYIILTEINNNELNIKRIAINPFINNYNYNSKILLYKLLELKNKKKININLNEIYEYDPRFKLSWKYY
jgi:hypothetical protein